MKKIGKRKQVVCENCGTPFSIYIEAYEKLKKDNKSILCSVNCANHEIKVEPVILKQENIVGDNETIFKFHYKELLQKEHIIKVSISDIKNQWDKQNGTCELTSLPLELNLNLSSNSINSPVLIKRDKTKLFTKDNIIWVCKPIAILSNTFNEDIYNLTNQLFKK